MLDEAAGFRALVGQLCGVGSSSARNKLVIGFIDANGEPDLRFAPPALTAALSNSQLRNLVSTFQTRLPEGTQKVGLVFPARRGGTEVVARVAGSNGNAVCVAGGMTDGVGSVGLFLPYASDSWDEAHVELDWLCEPLRDFVGKGHIEGDESAVFKVRY
jgi:hypothetical protein